MYACGDLSPSVQNVLVILPLTDTQGKLAGSIEAYAMLSANYKNKLAVDRYMEYSIYRLNKDFEPDEYASVPRNYVGIYIGKYCAEIFLGNHDDVFGRDACKLKPLRDLVFPVLDSTEMNLQVWGSALDEYSDLITEYIQDPDTADWEELEKSINIYLSE